LIHTGHWNLWNSSHFCCMGIHIYRGECELLLR